MSEYYAIYMKSIEAKGPRNDEIVLVTVHPMSMLHINA